MVGIDIDDVLSIAKGNALLNQVQVKVIQADIFPWLRDPGNAGERFATW